MKEINVPLEKETYSIRIERGLLDRCGALVSNVTAARHIAVISDAQVDALYGQRLENTLTAAGIHVVRLVFPQGEKSKCVDRLVQLYEQLAAAEITRDDCIITLGGGVSGDLGGFAAATFLRGIPFIQIPTTVIAQVDSSVGGKVAIDLRSGKNLVGSFYQPSAVWIDPDLLQTLPQAFIRDGMGEVIKYGYIRDIRLVERLEAWNETTLSSHWEEIIAACCTIKAVVVAADTRDTGERQILNFGHTIGHAVEGFYGFGTYTHGQGVAIGMSRLTARTEAAGMTEAGVTKRLRRLLQRYGLPIDVPASAEELLPFIKHDKKRRGQMITLVVVPRPGTCRLVPIALSEAAQYIGK